MKKMILLGLSLLVIVLFVVSCAPKEGTVAGEAKALPAILKPQCSYLISPAGYFKMTKELTLEKGIFGNPSLLADKFNEDEITNGCLGVYQLRSCISLDYLNEEAPVVGSLGYPYSNQNFVQVAIVKLPEGTTEETILEMTKDFPSKSQITKEEFIIKKIKPYNQPSNKVNVWVSRNDHLLWISGDLLIEVVGPLAKADWSLLDVYYKKYPPTG